MWGCDTDGMDHQLTEDWSLPVQLRQLDGVVQVRLADDDTHVWNLVTSNRLEKSGLAEKGQEVIHRKIVIGGGSPSSNVRAVPVWIDNINHLRSGDFWEVSSRRVVYQGSFKQLRKGYAVACLDHAGSFDLAVKDDFWVMRPVVPMRVDGIDDSVFEELCRSAAPEFKIEDGV